MFKMHLRCHVDDGCVSCKSNAVFYTRCLLKKSLYLQTQKMNMNKLNFLDKTFSFNIFRKR